MTESHLYTFYTKNFIDLYKYGRIITIQDSWKDRTNVIIKTEIETIIIDMKLITKINPIFITLKERRK